MLASKRQNFHHSKLPRLGAIVTVRDRPLGPGRRYRRFIVESFPLCDNDRPYSFGIHTCMIRALDNGERFKIAGHWCHDDQCDE
jgi:hypothetical protein